MANKKRSEGPGRKKLSQLGVELPPLPTMASSLPKQPELIELRYKVAKGVQPPGELDRKEKLLMEVWVRQQEKLGLDVLSDGEMDRGDMLNFFADRIQGFQPGGTVRSYGNRYYRKPIIKEKLEWRAPISVETWRYAQRLTHRPLKALITGPMTLMDWSFNEYYSSRESACRDLTEILRREASLLAEAGAKIIEIDEPAISSRPSEFSMAADAIKEITRDIKAYFILHHAYGDLSMSWEKMRRLPVDNFRLEMTNSRFALLPLLKKFPTTKDLTIGVLDSHTHLTDSPTEIKQRILKGLSVTSPGQLWVSPDWGLKNRTPDEAVAKLKALTETTSKIRASLR